MGKWGQLQLAKEGSGRMVFLCLPITGGNIEFSEIKGDLSDGCLNIEVDLTIEEQSTNGETKQCASVRF